MGTALLTSCGEAGKKAAPEAEFKYEVDRFEDISVLKYRLPAFEQLTTGEKEFIYYLSEAALCGRDILWDQNFKYNLLIRKTIEAIIDTYDGDRESDDYKAFITYAGESSSPTAYTITIQMISLCPAFQQIILPFWSAVLMQTACL